MFIEFALTLSLFTPNIIPNAGPPITQIDFTQPVQQVITYPPTGIINRLSGLQLPGDTLTAFETEFQDGNVYYGAFAITKEFDYGYVTGTNSLQAAREIAIAECLKHGPVCMVYAEIVPTGYVPLEDGQVTLAPEATGHFTEPNSEWGNFRAMAISEDGAYSVVWNYGSPREASDAAMSDCSGYTITDLPGLRDMPCMLIPFK